MIGRAFSFELIAAVEPEDASLDESALKLRLDRLVDAGVLVVEKGTTSRGYRFKRALVQDAAYESLLVATRQQYRRIAVVLENRFTALAESHRRWLRITTHKPVQTPTRSRTGCAPANVPYVHRRILRPSPTQRMGLRLLETLPAAAEPDAHKRHDQDELQLLLTLGPAYMATLGYAAREVESVYARASVLCRAVGDSGRSMELAQALHGLWTFNIVCARHPRALTIARQLLKLGLETKDIAVQIQGNMDVGWSNFFVGRLRTARRRLKKVLKLYDHELHGGRVYRFGDNPLTSAAGCLAQVLWLSGHPDAALERSQLTLQALRTIIDHPYSVAFGIDLAAFIRQYRGEVAATRSVAEEGVALARAQGMAFIEAMAAILVGWCVVRDGDPAGGVQLMNDGLRAQLGTVQCWPSLTGSA